MPQRLAFGWTILNNDGSFFDIGHLDLKNIDNEYKKCSLVREFLQNLPCLIDKIFIEAPLMMFQKNKSMAATISKLQRWNGMVSWVCFDELAFEPVLLNPISARSQNGLKIPKGANTKLTVFNFVKLLNVVPDNSWAYKKTGNPKDWCFDQADSYIIARAGFLQTT